MDTNETPSAEPAPSRGLTYPRGFTAAAGTCGIKPSQRPDLMILAAEQAVPAAAVFTTSKMPGAPVVVSRRHIRAGVARGVVCNSGIANVANGQAGIDDAEAMCQRLAQHLNAEPHEVLVCSTGVIGRRLPMDRILPGIDRLSEQLAAGEATDVAAAEAILTTDLRAKTAIREGPDGIRLAGIAKGSGMIAPNMATMLAFITTDAAVSPAMLRQALSHAVQQTFNRINVDSDTSTSDSVMILASGAAEAPAIEPGSQAAQRFEAALTELCADLAQQVVRDGEGANKVFTVRVCGAADVEDADAVGRTVTGSPLVKTAVHGGDPNWGRLIMAVGRSGATVVPEKLSIHVGEVCLFAGGQGRELSDAEQRTVAAAMGSDQMTFTIDLGLGEPGACACWLGCDLSREYIAINADYRT